ncbi:MAG TPA: flotillin-like protein FloA [Opitutaceae bacterium]|nr:flotillin-like protein FloA [Opitutaceae bacterium]
MDISVVVIVVAAIVALVILAIVAGYLGTLIKARLNGAPVGIMNLIGMRFGGVPYNLVVTARITAVKAGIPLSTDKIAAHYLAGGNVVPTVQALIAAQKAGISLDWDRACAIDLATKGSGKSVVEAVRTSVDPKVIDCPNPESGRTTIDGVAKDGIQVKVKARVTVRTHLDRFVGGAKEETIIARVGEGIVTTIGVADTYKHVLESPDSISKTVLARGLDVGSAFEILSIDIADVDVGENIGARLQVAQAEANKNMAQAQAEIRRAAAVALEQEMKAKVQEMQAKVVDSQAQVPLAMAEAFRSGRLGVMDYYRMENIQSDTSMRSSIAQPEQKK